MRPSLLREKPRKILRVWLPAFLAVICLGTVMPLPGRDEWSHARGAGTQRPGTRFADPYGTLPLGFEIDQGQADPRVNFLSRGRGYTLFLTVDEAVLLLQSASREARVESRNLKVENGEPTLEKRQSVRPAPSPQSLEPPVLRMKLAGANANPQARGVDGLPGKSNYFIGNDPRNWRTNVPNYSKVKCTDVYPDIDLIYYGDQQQLEFDFVAAPGADPRAIRLAFEIANSKSEHRQSQRPEPRPANPGLRTPNAGSVHVNANGDLVVPIDGGEVRFHKPRVYQEEPSSVRGQLSAAKDQEQRINDHRQFIDGRYVLRAAKAKSQIQNTKPPSKSPSTTLGSRWSSIRF